MTFATQFYDHVVGLSWSLWNELGVTGTERHHNDCLIELEELIILTATVVRHDARLRDEALGWCSKYHNLISVSRLRALIKELPKHAHQSYVEFASMFNSASRVNLPEGLKKSEIVITLSKKPTLPSLQNPALLSLRLRSLFGPGTKADALTYLFTHNNKDIAASDLGDLGYSKRATLTALDNLTAAGILSGKTHQNKKIYAMSQPNEFRVIIGQLPKQAPPWKKILLFILEINELIPELEHSSDIGKTVLLRNALIKTGSLLPEFIAPILESSPEFQRDWVSTNEFLRMFKQGNFYMYYAVNDDIDQSVINFLAKFYPLIDCTDGLEYILDKARLDNKLHQTRYLECYQLFLTFVADLKAVLAKFIDFPFHKLGDEPLVDIAHKFSKEPYDSILNELIKLPTIDMITSPTYAIRVYQSMIPILNSLHQFTTALKQRLAATYVDKTGRNLWPQRDDLKKRHLVIILLDPHYS
jgi:hypothetical protein